MTIETDYKQTFNFLPNDASFELRDVELYVPVVTLSKNNEVKLYENFKNGLSREIAQNKYLSRVSKQNNNTDLNDLVDPTFVNVHRIFVLGNELANNGASYRHNISYYYIPHVLIKDSNVLIDGKPFFDQLIKNIEESYEKIVEMDGNNDYTTGNLLDFHYFKIYHKFNAVDLSRKQNKDFKEPEQINVVGKIRNEPTGIEMFVIIESKQKATLNFMQNNVVIINKHGNTKNNKFIKQKRL